MTEDSRFWHAHNRQALLEQNKILVTLASGGIGATILFVINESKPACFVDLVLPALSWSGYILSILFVLLSLHQSRNAAEHQLHFVEYEALGYDTAEFENLIADSTTRSHIRTLIAQWCFFIGVILTVVFIIVEI
jgi:hypothetical protein